MIDAYYGSQPQYSYFTGCSGAGAHGLQMAQKYPDLDPAVADSFVCMAP